MEDFSHDKEIETSESAPDIISDGEQAAPATQQPDAEPPTKKLPRSRKKAFQIQQLLFSLVLLVFCVIGLLIPLRPDVSESEKRDLTDFPKFSISSFLDGSFFSQLETWYADTYPLREGMISLNSKFESLFGNRKEQMIGEIVEADDVPEVNTDEGDFDWLYDPGQITPTTKDPSQTAPPSPETTEDAPDTGDAPKTEETTTTTQEEELVIPPAKPVDPNAVEQINSLYVIGDTAYELYYFNQSNADRYVKLVNNLADRLGSDVTVYSIIAPLSYGINLSDVMQEKLKLTDEDEALIYFYSQMNSNVKKVYIYRNLLAHRDEYLYFRTDHHWTALGAYYAYEVFCHQKGITPQPLSNMEMREYSGFLGTLYSSANKPAALANNPDTVYAWVPNGTNDMVYYDPKGNKNNWKVVTDVSNFKTGTKYNAFIASDQPFSEIHNPTINDGSSCVVVKNSYGNCFTPFLVDHYEYVYVVDFRSFPDWSNSYNNGQTFTEFVRAKGIDDVILVSQISGATSTASVDSLENCISK